MDMPTLQIFSKKNPEEELREKVEYLTQKSNQQAKLLQQKKSEIEELKGKLEEKNFSPELQKPDTSQQGEDSMKILSLVLQRIDRAECLIPYKNVSKNSKEFYKVTKQDLDRHIAALQETRPEKNIGKIMDFFLMLGVFKKGTGGQMLIRKTAYDQILGDAKNDNGN